MQTTLKTNVQSEPLAPPTGVNCASRPDSVESLRANCYALLGALMAAPPTQQIVDVIRSIDDVEADGNGEAMAQAWHGLKLAGDSADDLEALNDEYHKLFVGLGRGELMPYGSWYLTGFLMEQPLAALRRDLRRLGFERQDDVKEPEDHAAALCETMGMIISGSSAEVPFDEQKQFFKSHIEPWIKQFFSDLQKAESARFYQAVGLFGESFFDVEARYFSMTV